MNAAMQRRCNWQIDTWTLVRDHGRIIFHWYSSCMLPSGTRLHSWLCDHMMLIVFTVVAIRYGRVVEDSIYFLRSCQLCRLNCSILKQIQLTPKKRNFHVCMSKEEHMYYKNQQSVKYKVCTKAIDSMYIKLLIRRHNAEETKRYIYFKLQRTKFFRSDTVKTVVCFIQF